MSRLSAACRGLVAWLARRPAARLGIPGVLAVTILPGAWVWWPLPPALINPTAQQSLTITDRHGLTLRSTRSPLGLPVPVIPATGKRRQWPQESLTVKARDGQLVSRISFCKRKGELWGRWPG